jgi:hypothetical protein
MWHAAGFTGEDAAILATAGITRKYGFEVMSFSLALVVWYLCA